MKHRELIEYLPVNVSEGTRIIVLKSRYNRYAGRINATRFEPVSKHILESYAHLKYLKEQIDNCEHI